MAGTKAGMNVENASGEGSQHLCRKKASKPGEAHNCGSTKRLHKPGAVIFSRLDDLDLDVARVCGGLCAIAGSDDAKCFGGNCAVLAGP
jgi:hypothetical protein